MPGDVEAWSGDVEQRVRDLAHELELLQRWFPVRAARSLDRRWRRFRTEVRRLAGRPEAPLVAPPPPEGVTAAVAAAAARAAAGDPVGAERVLEEARRSHPGRIELLVAHAEIPMARRDFVEAERRWRRLLDVFGRVAPDEAVARLAFALRMQDRSDEAVAVVSAAPPARTPEGRAVVAFELGAALAEEGRWRDALDVFARLAAADGVPPDIALATDSLVLSVARRGALPVPDELRPEVRAVADHLAPRPSTSTDPVLIDDRDSGRPVRRVSFLIDATGGPTASIADTVASLTALRGPLSGTDCVVVGGADGPSATSGGLAIRSVAHDPSGAAAFEVARRHAAGDLLVPLAAGDRLDPSALLHLHAAASGGLAVLLYADQDVLDADGSRLPELRPDWDPDLLLVNPYLGGLVAFGAAAVARVGGFRTTPAPAPDLPVEQGVTWDAALRLWFAGELGPTGEHVRRIPRTLLHRPPRGGVAVPAATFAPRTPSAAAIEHLNAHVLPARIRIELTGPDRVPRAVHALPASPPLVSVIVPTRDRHDLLHRCLASVRATSGDVPTELVVVDNDSTDRRTLDLLEELSTSGGAIVARAPGVFNFSHLVNVGVAAATGEVLLLLNNDVIAERSGWLEEMLRHALRPEIGAVGALLRHDDGRVQHAGVVLGGNGLAEHAFRDWPADAPGYLGLLRSQRRVTAVTAACLMVRRDVFDAAGGLDEEGLPVDLNDVDLCLRFRAMGLSNVVTPFARLVHAEGASRSIGVDRARTAATRRQQEVFLARWGSDGVLPDDPCYHPGLSLIGPSYRLAATG